MTYTSKEPKSLGSWKKLYGKFSQISASDKEIWGIGGMITFKTGRNEIYRREGITADNPLGTEWKAITGLPNGIAAKQISVSSDGSSVWAMSTSGNIYRRKEAPLDSSENTEWESIIGTFVCISLGKKDQIWGISTELRAFWWQESIKNWVLVQSGGLGKVSVEDNQAWSLGQVYNDLWVRTGISNDKLDGIIWKELFVVMVDVCIRNGQVWAIDERGQVYFRDGITTENPKGESWQVVSGHSQKKLKQIAINKDYFFGIDENNDLWCSKISNCYQESTTDDAQRIEKLEQQVQKLQAGLVEKEQEIIALKKKIDIYEKINLQTLISSKEKELNKAKEKIISENNLDQDEVEELLEAQIDNNPKWLERTKKRLIKLVKEKELNLLLQTQQELTNLAKQIKELSSQVQSKNPQYEESGYKAEIVYLPNQYRY